MGGGGDGLERAEGDDTVIVFAADDVGIVVNAIAIDVESAGLEGYPGAVGRWRVSGLTGFHQGRCRSTDIKFVWP